VMRAPARDDDGVPQIVQHLGQASTDAGPSAGDQDGPLSQPHPA